MIHVTRLAQPAYLKSSDVKRWTQQLCARRENYYRDLSNALHLGGQTKLPKRPSADGKHYGHPDVRFNLKLMFGTKCAYCEGEVAAVSPQHVEHFRPAARYPALAYDWENLLLACPHCNSTYKSDQFPIAPSGNTLRENRRKPCARTGIGEVPLLLNPCNEYPEAHITYRDGRAIPLSHQGKRTIRVCRLNREELLEHRIKWLKLVRRSMEEYSIANLEKDDIRKSRYADDLREFTHDSATYSAMVRTELALNGIDWATL